MSSARAMVRELAPAMARGIGLALLLALYALVLLGRCDGRARAQDLEDPARVAALWLSQYAAHEADFRAPGDLLLIWQCAETHADDLEGRVRWLHRHSRCVVGPPRVTPRRRCRWARQLRWSAARPPAYPAGWPFDGEGFRLYLELALRVVRGEERRRPCAGQPQTWDGRAWREQRLEDGFTELECVDPFTGRPTLNAGYRFPHWRRARHDG